MTAFLSGNEALARGAREAGVRVAAGYPGTPSTEVLDRLALMPDVYAEWSPNEKVALDVAVGAAYAGKRSLAVMKHVGLNVAADSLFYAAMTGAAAGLVIIVADDPGMHSSQGEQDSRRYAKFARVPCLEPGDSQEAKDMVPLAFEISEAFDTPVIVRTTTRIAHSYGVVALGSEPSRGDAASPPCYHRDPEKYVMVPAFARRRHPIIEEHVAQLSTYAEGLAVNRVEMRDPALGIVTHGIAYQYVREVFPEASVLRLGMSYPLPARMVRAFAAAVERVLVVEELDPVIEEEIKLLGIACEGKSIFPIVGELDPGLVRACACESGLLPGSDAVREPVTDIELPARPPALCPGCPHRGVYAMAGKLKLVVNGDIGCYALGFLPPLSAVHSIGCMGASIGVAHGVATAGIVERNIAVIGDSTFFHSGIPALLNIAYNRSQTTVVVLDNRTTAMTGHQENPGSGKTLQGQVTGEAKIEDVARALGIEHVQLVDPYDLAAVESALVAATEHEGPSVIVSRRACALAPGVRGSRRPLQVDAQACTACYRCVAIGCPALCKCETVVTRKGKPTVRIDALLCAGCGICAQVCPSGAISTVDGAV